MARAMWIEKINSRCFAQLSRESFRTPVNVIYGSYLILASRKFSPTNRHDGQRP